ncbi:trypsin-like peptidase domain-containing protein [Streptomyces sp. NPDC002073]
MDLDRRVQVRLHRTGGGSTGFGSGYLIAPRLVLTAGHVVAGPGTVSVCLPGRGPERFPAVVRWYRRDARTDTALLEVSEERGWLPPESLAGLRARTPQRWGAMIGPRPLPVTTLGFPRVRREAEAGGPQDEQVEVTLRPGAGSLAGRYELVGADAPVPGQLPLPAGGTLWSGMSGAAVLAGDLLCGVVRRDRQAGGGTRLTATPAAVLLADPEFRAHVGAHTGREPWVEPAEPARLLSPAEWDDDLRSPAMPPGAEAEAVGFRGRHEELRVLAAWCADPAPFAVHVLTGPGGRGTSRPARQLAGMLRRTGWVTGRLRPDLRDVPAAPPGGPGAPSAARPGFAHEDGPDLSTLDTHHWLLLVVDDADTRPQVVRRLVEHLSTTRHRVRLLLLARSDGEWRTDAMGASAQCRHLLARAPVHVTTA